MDRKDGGVKGKCGLSPTLLFVADKPMQEGEIRMTIGTLFTLTRPFSHVPFSPLALPTSSPASFEFYHLDH